MNLTPSQIESAFEQGLDSADLREDFCKANEGLKDALGEEEVKK